MLRWSARPRLVRAFAFWPGSSHSLARDLPRIRQDRGRQDEHMPHAPRPIHACARGLVTLAAARDLAFRHRRRDAVVSADALT